MVAEIWALVISPFVDQWVALTKKTNNVAVLLQMFAYNECVCVALFCN